MLAKTREATIRERCACGAEFELRSPDDDTLKRYESWRLTHTSCMDAKRFALRVPFNE